MTGVYVDYQRALDFQMNTEQIRKIIESLEFEDTWKFEIRGFGGNTTGLSIFVHTTDNLDKTKQTIVHHTFPIPDFKMPQEEAERWVLENIFHVLKHEACEKFKINGESVYFPEHGEFANPYVVRRITDGR